MFQRFSILISSILLLVCGAAWLLLNWSQPDRFCAECFPTKAVELSLQSTADALSSGVAVSMDSPFFRYFPDGSWQISEAGADPGQPADPDAQPAGVVEFEFRGNELNLLIATGNFWGYMLIQVDGKPANLLPTHHKEQVTAPVSLTSSFPERGFSFKTFYEPETQTEAEWRAAIPTTRWMRVHHADGPVDATHTARIEIWRSWGQTPLRGVAVDALPPEPEPLWPGMLLCVVGLGLLIMHPRREQFHHALLQKARGFPVVGWIRNILDSRWVAWCQTPVGYYTIGAVGLVGLVTGTTLNLWWLALPSLALLSATTLFSMVPWVAALLLALPFYFGVTLPLIPGRAFGLLDVGILGGFALLLIHLLLSKREQRTNRERQPLQHGLLFLIIGWTLVTVFASDYFDFGLHEWRTVFLNGGLFALLLYSTISKSDTPKQTRTLLVSAWLLGGTVVALIGLWQYLSGAMLITAEGVHRVRALYGSPNNLALYLDRTLAVSLALGLLLESTQWRWVWRGAALVQLAALILTFSKGALFLGLPTMLVAIGLAVYFFGLQNRVGQNFRFKEPPKRILIAIGIVGLLSLVALTPFLGTERFQQLLDFSQGTSFLRLQLWRGSWAMALDNLPFGVGPDNFLYSYRSDYILPAAWQERDLNHPHNWVLDWWTRLGVPGLILGVTFWGVGLWQVVRRLRFGVEQSTFGVALNVGIAAAVMASSAHGLIDASYALPDLMIVWIFLLLL